MFKQTLCAAVVMVGALGAPVWAQADDPNAVLDASREAIKQTPGFSAQFRMYGDGSDMIKSTMPGLNGRMVFGDHPEYGRSLRVVGQATEKKDAPPYAVDMLKSDSAIVWVDMEKQTINEHPANVQERIVPTAVKLMMYATLLDEDPFGDRLDQAESITLEDQETVGGELCDIVRIDYAKNAGSSGRRRGARPTHTSARWAIAVSDHLPRKIEYLTDGGMIKYRMVTEVSSLVVADPKDDEIDVMRRPGFTLKSTLHPPEPTGEEDDQADATPASQPTSPVGTRGRDNTPSYSFTDAAGVKVSDETQQGRVTVLYFGGSWCLPCKKVSPRISDLAKAMDGQPVDVFEIAVRESDPSAAERSHEDAGYATRFVRGAESLTQPFRVRVYPTVVVLGKDGSVVSVSTLGKKTNDEQLASEVMLKVKESLAG